MDCLLKYAAISLYFTKNQSLLERGENSFLSKNVVRVDFDAKLLVIRGEVKASMKAKTYKVQIFLTADFNVEKAACECPRGILICHHIAAVMFASRYEISKTDLPCSWVPPTIKVEEIKTWKDLYNIPKPNRVSQRDLLDTEITEFRDELTNELRCGFAWILKGEVSKNQLTYNVSDVRLVLLSQDYIASTNPTEFLKNKLKMTTSDIQSTAKATIGQFSNILWWNVRRFRIRASNFILVISSITRNRFPPSLFEKLLAQRNLSSIKAVEWGKTHEEDGIRELEQHLCKAVVPTGAWLSEAGVLAASPDGLVDDSCIAANQN